jgi:antitoxin (DNA-binding transcriptional repressor) of toxin-antitoxin stability system
MERIDETQFLADPRTALERARSSGETLEILKDGRTVARLIPAPSGRRVQPGGSKAVLALADPSLTLDDLLTHDDVAAWYSLPSPSK